MVFSIIAEFFTVPWLLANICIGSFLYYVVLNNWSFFSDRNVKFSRGIPFLGTNYRNFIGKESFADSFRRLYREFPNEKFYGIFDLGGNPRYVIRDPELIKQIAIKDFDHFTNHMFNVHEESDLFFSRSLFMMRDQRWRDMRSILSPAFTGSKMRLMCGLLVDVCQTFCDSLKKHDGKSIECDVKDYVERFANDAIASSAFGVKVDSVKEKDNQFYKTGQKLSNFDFVLLMKFFAYTAFPKIMNFLKIPLADPQTVNYFRTLVADNIKYREENNIVRNDMINIMMEVKKGMLSVGTDLDDEDRELLSSTKTMDSAAQKKWSDDDLLAQSMGFFVAGFQTVSLTLSFAAHELTVNPDAQQKLYEEVQEVKHELNGKPLTYEQLQKMKYLDMVMSETLRRWPQGIANDRLVNKPYILENSDGTKVKLNPGEAIMLNVYGIHMDPKYHPNPEQFMPERFSEENKDKIVPGSYLPFGLGPRSCIASRFAIMESKMFLYYLVDNFKLEMSSKTQHPMVIKKKSGSIEAENGFWMKLRSRD